jgi:hypothetical protein
MPINAASMAQIMRDPRKPDATTRPCGVGTDQTVSARRASRARVSHRSDGHRERPTSIFGVTLQFD